MLALTRVVSQCARTVSTAKTSYGVVSPVFQIVRNTSFFNKTSADQLWKGVTSVSNAGKKRGRAKGISKKGMKNLNKGQIIGVGRANMVWPGLTGPIIRGRELVQQQQLPPNPEYHAGLNKLRDSMTGKKRMKLHPLERGWSGAKIPGRSIGPPDPVGEDTFEGFDTKVLEFKTVVVMTGNLGRRRRLSVYAITGNKQGLAGIALGKSMEGKAAMRRARNRAGQRLIHFDVSKDHSVQHDFYCQFGRTKIFVSKKPEGFGLVCHRAIRTCCEMIGIKNLYAKVEGSTNLQHVVKAFFIGLLQQKSHQQLAEEKQLHLVEMREERDNYPVVLASPSVVKTTVEARLDTVLDFKQYVMGNRVVLRKKKWPRYQELKKGWEYHLKKTLYMRNHKDVKVRLKAEYGDLRSFLADKYPECVKRPYRKPAESEETS